MRPPTFDVLCAGIIVVDHVCAPIARIPPAGGLEMTERIELTIGGCASNVAVDLSRLGLRACVAGRVGDDVHGRHVVAALAAEGVAGDQITFSTTAQTASTLVVNVRGEDRRFIHAAGANENGSRSRDKPIVDRIIEIVRFPVRSQRRFRPEIRLPARSRDRSNPARRFPEGSGADSREARLPGGARNDGCRA